MTTVSNGKIRRWYISKYASNNCGNERYISFSEFKPTIAEKGHEWIPVISLDDFHKEVNINISRWVEICQELQQAKAQLKEAVELLKYSEDDCRSTGHQKDIREFLNKIKNETK